MDYNKMKVADLKAELAARNLDTKGVKAVLMERLKEAIEQEGATTTTTIEQPPTDGKLLAETPSTPSIKNDEVGTPARRSRRRSMTRSPSPQREDGAGTGDSEQHTPSITSSARKKRRSRSMTKSPSPHRAGDVKCLEAVQEEPEAEQQQPAAVPHRQAGNEVSAASPNKELDHCLNLSFSGASDNATVGTDCSMTEEPEAADENEALNEASEGDTSGVGDTSTTAMDDDKDEKSATESDRQEAKEAEKPAEKLVEKPAPDFIVEENEPTVADADAIRLSWYDSDLNLVIDTENMLSAKPLSDDVFSLVWAGVRSSHGVKKGKVLYEVLITEQVQPKQVTDEPVVAEFRIGWSAEGSNLQLGEDKLSYCYGSSGKKAVDCTFEDYGIPFKKHDVIGAYLDMDANPCRIEYTVNNAKQGVAFEFDRDTLGEKGALFPHLYTKNSEFKVNFGQCEESLLHLREELIAKEKKESAVKPATASSADASVSTEKKAAVSEEKDAKEKKEDKADKDGKDDKDEKEEKDDKQDDQEAKPVVEKMEEDEEKKEQKEGDEEKSEEKTELAEEKPVETEEEVAAPVDKTLDPNYTFIKNSGADCIVVGLLAPETRGHCEVTLTIGLPGCGKTKWVQKYIQDNADKNLTLLSVESLLQKMKILGQPRLPSNTVNWQKTIEKLARCMNKLVEIANKRRRNYVIDQTNVYAYEQKRRLRGFGGFSLRRAVVVVPTLEEYKRRYESKVERNGKEVLDGTINAMKANFSIPFVDEGWFTEIVFPDLDDKEARELVKTINEEGRKLLPPRRNRNQQNRKQNNQSNNKNSNNNNNNNNSSNNRRWMNQKNQGPMGRYGSSNQRYNNDQYRQDYRPGNGYGRRDDRGYGGGPRNDWTRNSNSRRFSDNRFSSYRGYQADNSRYDGRRDMQRGNRRSYNNGAVWNQQGGSSWNYGNNPGSTEQWYSWWQSNLKNLLQHQGGQSAGQQGSNSSSSNMDSYWGGGGGGGGGGSSGGSQYNTQHHQAYGSNQQSK